MTELDMIKQEIKNHVDNNNKDFATMFLEIKDLKRDVSNLRDNHLSHIAKDIEELRIGAVKDRENIKWLVKGFWIVAGAVVGNLIAALYQLIEK